MNNFIQNNISSDAIDFIDSDLLDQAIKESENLDQFYSSLNYNGLNRFIDHQLAINNIFIDQESDQDNEKYYNVLESVHFNFMASSFNDDLLDELITDILDKRERN